MMPHVTGPVLLPEVRAALRDGAPVVALESTLLAHGLPAPRNREVADELEAVVRSGGAVPATVAVLDGVPRVGLTAAELDRVCGGDLVKLSVRDLGVAVGLRRDGATTVAATAALAAAPASRSSRRAGWAGCTAARGRAGTSRPTSRRWPAHPC
jgi:pseudouridylate synthase